ncbi:MAG: hypothetical protein PHQ20_00720 [Candidatus Moranbacteria bacterium]|nr:hypothetical protein [Candidatus Moranbacteria bacterium]
MPNNKKVPADKAESLELEKIKSLQEMIANAEQTIISAKQMLAKLKGEKLLETKKPSQPESDGRVIYGNFDGQIMVGQDGKQYPVPANYASKSKLVEGDMLKLTMTPNGNFIYKQVGPVERKYLLGIVELDTKGNYVVETNGKKYKVLLAAATYFKIEPGDEVTLVVPRDTESIWGAIENVLRKAEDIEKESHRKTFNSDFSHLMEKEQEPEKKENESYEEEKIPLSAVEKLAKEIEEERKRIQKKNDSILDEWTPDLEEIKKEASYPARNFDE